MNLCLNRQHNAGTIYSHDSSRYYCRLRSYKKGCFFLLIDVFFDVESESEIHYCRSPLFLELQGKNPKNMEKLLFFKVI